MFDLRSSFTRIALIACLAAPAAAWSQVISVSIAPPPLPVYVQPPIPDDGYIWSPGYWAYDDGDYYWVPGTWVRPPAVGLLWTPGYWAWNNGLYVFNRGYWGPHVGFYGGVDYGYGYTGSGYHGGYWRGGVFNYNRSINNFGNRRITHVYNKKVVNNITVNRISYNGGHGGVNARPNTRQQKYAHEKHVAPTKVQVQHAHTAVGNREQRASVNHGQPPIAATNRPGRFSGAGVVAARQADGKTPERPHQEAAPHPQDKRADPQHRQPTPKAVESGKANPVHDNAQQAHPQPNAVKEQARPPQVQQREQQQDKQREQAQQREQQDKQREQVQQREQTQQREQQAKQREQQAKQREQVQQREQQHAPRPQPQREPQHAQPQRPQPKVQMKPAPQHEQARAPQPQAQHAQAQRPPQARAKPEARKPQGQPHREERGRD